MMTRVVLPEHFLNGICAFYLVHFANRIASRFYQPIPLGLSIMQSKKRMN